MSNFTAELRAISKRFTPRGRAYDGRSALFHWMYQRAELFRRVLDDSNPSWESVAAALADHGLTDGRGSMPTATRVRKTWLEVRRAKGWVSAKSMPEHAKPAVAPFPSPLALPMPPPPRVAPAVTSPPPAADDDQRAQVERFRRQIALRSGRNV